MTDSKQNIKYISNIENIKDFKELLNKIFTEIDFAVFSKMQEDELKETLKTAKENDNFEKIKNIVFYKWFKTKAHKWILTDASGFISKSKDEKYTFNPKPELIGNLLYFKEYFDLFIDALLSKNKKHKIKLQMFTSLSYPETHKKANKAKEKSLRNQMKDGEMPEQRTIKHLSHGYELVELKSLSELDYEGLGLRHCVGEGKADKWIKNKNIDLRVFSIRKTMKVKDRLSGKIVKRSIPFVTFSVHKASFDENFKISGNVLSIEGLSSKEIKYHLHSKVDKKYIWRNKYPPYLHVSSEEDATIPHQNNLLLEAIKKFLLENDLVICGELEKTPCFEEKIKPKQTQQGVYSLYVNTLADLKTVEQLKNFKRLHIPKKLVSKNKPYIIKVEDWATQKIASVDIPNTYDLSGSEVKRIIISSPSTVYAYNCPNLEEIKIHHPEATIYIEPHKQNMLEYFSEGTTR